MACIENIGAGDSDVLTSARYWNLVRIVLACGYRVWLARRIYTDYLDHKISVLVLIVSAVSAIGEVAGFCRVLGLDLACSHRL